mmetsp:Transcript_11211/g.18968  ORF Transcript_11211/g.18968 Transcript_11211/m.18968 type:complete len:132 (-) Transcript_11211:385-780(-)
MSDIHCHSCDSYSESLIGWEFHEGNNQFEFQPLSAFSSGTFSTYFCEMHPTITAASNTQKSMQQLGPSPRVAGAGETTGVTHTAFGGHTHEVVESTSCGSGCAAGTWQRRGQIRGKINPIAVLGPTIHSQA